MSIRRWTAEGADLSIRTTPVRAVNAMPSAPPAHVDDSSLLWYGFYVAFDPGHHRSQRQRLFDQRFDRVYLCLQSFVVGPHLRSHGGDLFRRILGLLDHLDGFAISSNDLAFLIDEELSLFTCHSERIHGQGRDLGISAVTLLAGKATQRRIAIDLFYYCVVLSVLKLGALPDVGQTV